MYAHLKDMFLALKIYSEGGILLHFKVLMILSK